MRLLDRSNLPAVFPVIMTGLLFSFSLLPAQNFIGDHEDGSRTRPVHIIKLIDPDSSGIRRGEMPQLPFSTRNTCGACHNYKKISGGWHFNAGDTTVNDGRPGEPWIYADPWAAVQIPLSYRNWPGTYHPDELGMDAFDFTARFGRQMTGGGVGEREAWHSLDKYWRWQVSGNLEINCLACHDAERAHHQSASAQQAHRQNFRWAATASSGLARVEGSAKDMPDNYDIYGGSFGDRTDARPPEVFYDQSRFNDRSEVYLDITNEIDPDRCYFCHSSRVFVRGRPHDEDVHLKAGLLCVDCHANGLNHNITRGYDAPGKENQRSTLTCRGCHLGNERNGIPVNGRHGAPRPQHTGIPLIHFEKLSCTTCHSGVWPGEKPALVKTSMAHGLGIPGANTSREALPHIQTPVYIEQENGQIAPHKLLWPSLWVKVTAKQIQPLPLEAVNSLVRPVIAYLDTLGKADWPQLTDSILTKVLDTLATVADSGQAGYISNGKLYWLDKQGKLVSREDGSAKPYAWPLAHDVRPAEQALGVRGCDDCHSAGSDFFFASVTSETPVSFESKTHTRMTDFMNENTAYAWMFSFSFIFRPWLKYLIIIASLVILTVVTLFIFNGLSGIINHVSLEPAAKKQGRKA